MRIELEIDQGDLRCFVIAAARYSYRRMTYMPHVIAGIVERNLGVLDDGTREILARDIRQEIEMDERLNDMGEKSFVGGVSEWWKRMLPILEDKDGKNE